MTPTWTSPCGTVRLFLGDCREVLPTLSGVDAVVTDPPYGVGFSRYESHDDSPGAYEALIIPAVRLLNDAMRDGALAFVWQGMANADQWHKFFPPGYRLFAAARNFTQHLPTPVQYSWDPVVWWAKGKSSRRAVCGMRDYHIGNTARWVTEESNGHPCPRPLDTVQYVVELASDVDELVVDSFMGGGTTGVACVRTGRQFVGCEIEPRYFDIAVRRIEAELNRAPLFAEPQPRQLELAS